MEGEKIKILIVEDERIIAQDIEHKLSHSGYKIVGICISGEDAIKKAGRLKPDLILMDIVLKGKKDGVQAAETIKSRYNIPIIYITAFMDKKTLTRAKNSLPFGYLIKPFDEKELRVTIEMALFRHQLEKKLTNALTEWRITFDAVQDGIMLLDIDCTILRINRSTSQFLNLPYQDIIGKKCHELIHQENKPPAICPLKKMMRTKKHEEKEIFFQDRERWFNVSLDPIVSPNNKFKGAVHIMRDITEYKYAKNALIRSKTELLDLSRHLESAREQERTSIAREIHDELGQSLTALKMDLFWLKKKLSKNQKSLNEKVEDMSSLIDSTIQSVKRISSELRPGILDDLGIASAIEWQAEEFKNRTAIQYELEIVPKDMVLNEKLSTAFFRIFQEALTNITRHAQASKVKVSFKQKPGKVELKIRDNGKGISEEKIQDSQSYGLVGIRERVRSLYGEFKIKGIPNQGTTIIVKIPTK
jgi:PAS domain S-box-containing protein